MTRSQTKIAALIAKGHSNQEIADKLKCSEGWIKMNATRMYREFGLTSWGNNRVRLVLHLQRETPEVRS